MEQTQTRIWPGKIRCFFYKQVRSCSLCSYVHCHFFVFGARLYMICRPCGEGLHLWSCSSDWRNWFFLVWRSGLKLFDVLHLIAEIWDGVPVFLEQGTEEGESQLEQHQMMRCWKETWWNTRCLCMCSKGVSMAAGVMASELLRSWPLKMLQSFAILNLSLWLVLDTVLFCKNAWEWDFSNCMNTFQLLDGISPLMCWFTACIFLRLLNRMIPHFLTGLSTSTKTLLYYLLLR